MESTEKKEEERKGVRIWIFFYEQYKIKQTV